MLAIQAWRKRTNTSRNVRFGVVSGTCVTGWEISTLPAKQTFSASKSLSAKQSALSPSKRIANYE